MKFTEYELVIEIAGDNRWGVITGVHNQCPMKNEWLKGLECWENTARAFLVFGIPTPTP